MTQMVLDTEPASVREKCPYCNSRNTGLLKNLLVICLDCGRRWL